MLVDVSPDQSMLDEGVAREVINRIQKLRKKVWPFKQCTAKTRTKNKTKEKFDFTMVTKSRQ